MKKVTKIGAFLLVSIFAFTSCQNDSISPFDSDDESALLDFMFLATANDSTGTGGHKGGHGWRGGKKCKVTEVATVDLPAAVTSYISTNYTDATIDRAGKLENGNFVVVLTKADGTHTGLAFDATGVFIEERALGKGKHGTPVDIADLPEAVTSYISTNYEGSTIKKAITNDEGKFMVIIQKADETHVGLGFNADGTFISEMTRKGGKRGKKGKKG